jgi:hypothetical protein
VAHDTRNFDPDAAAIGDADIGTRSGGKLGGGTDASKERGLAMNTAGALASQQRGQGPPQQHQQQQQVHTQQQYAQEQHAQKEQQRADEALPNQQQQQQGHQQLLRAPATRQQAQRKPTPKQQGQRPPQQQQQPRTVGEARAVPSWPSLLPLAKGPALARPNCTDKQPQQQCRDWNASGDCDSNPSFMLHNCAATCGICSVRYLHGAEVAQQVRGGGWMCCLLCWPVPAQIPAATPVALLLPQLQLQELQG